MVQTNPFIIEGYLAPEYFCDRVEETALLTRHLTNRCNVALIAPRRLGKSGLMGTATALTANNQAEALQAVLAERRRELPFYYRFGDIKRFAVTSDTSDDVTVTREFFDMTATNVNTDSPKTYVIPGNSKCWAMPIYQTEINSSHGAIEQNPE